jgi:predicted nucleic acid-binding protein
MNDKFFLDSNICIYAFDMDNKKKEKALDLIISNHAFISTQVLMEVANITLKKFKFTQEQIQLSVDNLSAFCSLHLIELSTIKLAFEIRKKYLYSFYDSLIVAAALESNCTILYTEDLRHGQTIDKRLIIENPFL